MTHAQQLLSRLDEFGITRLADTTGLDRLGVPTASATRPHSTDVIWVYSGKGITQELARTVAVMEAVERTSALWPTEPTDVQWASETQMVARHGPDSVVRLGSLTEVPPGRAEVSAPVPWTLVDVIRGRQGPLWAPADFVFCGHRPATWRSPQPPYPVTTSNGLGAGPDANWALSHALRELAERDVVSTYEILSSHGGISVLASMATQAGLNPRWLADSYVDKDVGRLLVDLGTAPLIEPLRSSLTALGDVRAYALPNDFELPCFVVVAQAQIGLETYQRCQGSAVADTPEAALTHALLELAQTRATDLQGAREDRTDLEKMRHSEPAGSTWLDSGASQQALPWSEAVARSSFRPVSGLGDLLDRFASVGLGTVLTRTFETFAGLSVVHAVVPGVETWHATGGEGNWGPRIRRRMGGTV